MMHTKLTRLTVAAVLLAAGVMNLPAVQTASITQEGYGALAEGDFTGVALSADGRLGPATKLEEMANLDVPVVWASAWGPDGMLYLATGHPGKVIRVDRDGDVKTVFETEEILVRALTFASDGAMLVGTSPNGRVYRVVEGGAPSIYFDPSATYIWSLRTGSDGSVFLTTGLPATVVRLSPNHALGEEGEELFRARQDHLTTLEIANDGTVYTSSSPDGVLYAIRGDSHRALLQSDAEELRKVAVQAGGSVIFATYNSPNGVPPIPSGNNHDGNHSNNNSGSGQNDNGNDSNMLPAFQVQSSPPSGALFRWSPDGFTDFVWGPPIGSVQTFLQTEDESMLVGGSEAGILYRVNGRDDWERVNQLETGGEFSFVLADEFDGEGALIVTSHPGKIYRLGAQDSGATYESDVLDAGQTAEWGNLALTTERPNVNGLSLRTRTGNTEEPDDTWSDWMDAESMGRFFSNEAPTGRFLQYEIAWTDVSDLGVRSISSYYRLPNVAPMIGQVRVLPVGLDVVFTNGGQQTIDVNKLFTGNAQDIIRQNQPRQILRPSRESGRTTVAWRAVDPNNDRLRYAVYLQKLDELDWTLLAAVLDEPIYSMATDGFEDGFYRIEVVADDSLDNPGGHGLTSKAPSPVFLIDHRPPSITSSRQGDALVLDIVDQHSVIQSVAVTIDGGDKQLLLPEDGLFDSSRETVRHTLLEDADSIVVEVIDSSGNASIHRAGR